MWRKASAICYYFYSCLRTYFLGYKAILFKFFMSGL